MRKDSHAGKRENMVSKHSHLQQIALFVAKDDWLHAGKVDSGEGVN
jgi:hypothetical protein